MATNSPTENVSNESLTDVQKQEINRLMAKIQLDVDSIDARITKLLSSVEDLRLQRTHKLDRLATLKKIVSPLKDFPYEILSNIFIHYVHNLNSNNKHDMPKTPWFLGQICARWRQVALAIPDLWNHIKLRGSSIGNDQMALDNMATLFYRAGTSSISCMVELQDPISDISYITPLFSQNTKRFRHLAICSVNLNAKPILGLCGAHFAALEELDLYFDSRIFHSRRYPDPRNTDDTVTAFENAPLLQRVSFLTTPKWSTISNLNPLLFNLPWAQITSLTISIGIILPFTSTCELFRQCVNLITCSLCIPRDDPTIGEVPTTTLHNLQQLSIANISYGPYGQFLRSILLPSLKRFSLSAQSRIFSWDQAGVVDLITRSGCTIDAFQVLVDNGQNDLALDLLERMPNLKRLSIKEMKIFPSILKRIAHDGFLPQLTLLRCQITRLSDTANEIKEILMPSSFMEPPESGLSRLNIIFVPDHNFNIGYNGFTLMKGLERSRLKLSLQKNVEEDFLDYSDLGEQQTEDSADINLDAGLLEEDDNESDMVW